ncbi:MAG: hypothetical protein WC635_13815 [Bacteriovorax sp.]|jgi:hypothetical protein
MLIRHLSVTFFVFVVLFSGSVFSYGPNFPAAPDQALTPGKLCDQPARYRYPEQIAYCERDVSYETKEILIKKYDEQLGFHIQTMNRSDFKIDHLIPLCAGGSNDSTNLWPQHKSIYLITDAMEPLVCEKMAQGKLHQADAVKLIIRAKLDLSQVPVVIKSLQGL